MSCLIDSGLLKDSCQFLIGGVSNIYLANFDEVASFTGTGTYSAVTMATASNYFYKFETSKNTSSYTQVLTVSGNNKYVLQTVDFLVPRSDQAAFDLLDQLALGKFVAIIEDRMGKKVVIGELNGLEATVANSNSGVAEGDNSGIQVTLSAPALGYAHIFSGTIPEA